MPEEALPERFFRHFYLRCAIPMRARATAARGESKKLLFDCRDRLGRTVVAQRQLVDLAQVQVFPDDL